MDVQCVRLWAKAIASIAMCAAGSWSMWVSDGQTGIGWIIVGLAVIWG